ncbi:MAG: S1C family serine protease [Candidatus Anammoxibacter sp.]
MMRHKYCIVLGIFVTLLIQAEILLAQYSTEDLFKKCAPSVVYIVAENPEGKWVSKGSGFFVGDKCNVVTNYHVITNSLKSYVATIKDGNIYKRYKVNDIIAENKEQDIAILSLDIKPKSEPSLRINIALPTTGEDIIAIGNPQGYVQSISKGIVSAIREQEPYGQVIQMDVAVSPGSSGGPIINMNGEVIGMTTFIDAHEESEGLNFAVPGKTIHELLKNIGIPEKQYAVLKDGASIQDKQPETKKRFLKKTAKQIKGITFTNSTKNRIATTREIGSTVTLKYNGTVNIYKDSNLNKVAFKVPDGVKAVIIESIKQAQKSSNPDLYKVEMTKWDKKYTGWVTAYVVH